MGSESAEKKNGLLGPDRVIPPLGKGDLNEKYWITLSDFRFTIRGGKFPFYLRVIPMN